MTATRHRPLLWRPLRPTAALLCCALAAATLTTSVLPATCRGKIMPAQERKPSPRWQQLVRGLMGTRFFIQARVHNDAQAEALQRAMDRVAALERLWSPWIDGSDLHRINNAKGAAVTVEPETIALLRRSLTLCRQSGGAFDPTFFAL